MADRRWANIWKSTRGTWSSAMLTGERKILKKIKSIQKSGNLACKFFDRKTLQTFFDQVQLFHVWPWTKSTTRSSTQRRRKEQVSHVSLKKEMPSLKCRKTVSTCRVVYSTGSPLFHCWNGKTNWNKPEALLDGLPAMLSCWLQDISFFNTENGEGQLKNSLSPCKRMWFEWRKNRSKNN